MKIFLSWSGESSRQLAEALKTWLPDVVSVFRPWVSSEDVNAGARWTVDLARELRDAEVGIVCLTPDSVVAPWVLFEAGALAKLVGDAGVCVYLHELVPAQVQGPWVLFQAVCTTEADTLKLLRTLNAALGDQQVPDDRLERAFRRAWPDLASVIEAIPAADTASGAFRSDRDVLEELLDLTREVSKSGGPRPRQTPLPRPLPYSGADMFLDRQVEIFAEKRRGPIAHDDNAAPWMSGMDTDLQTPHALDGTWASRWFEEGLAGDSGWQFGTALVKCSKHHAVVVHTDRDASYLMVARWADDTTLIGRHYNLDRAGDTSPWIASVHDDRIDGEWERGHWDLRR